MPFIGCVSIQPSSSISKNSSGERDRIDRAAEIDQRAVFHRLARGQRVEGGQRVAGPLGLDRKGQVRLIAVALAQMPVQAVEALLVVLERPGRADAEDRPVGRRPAVLRQARSPTGRRRRRGTTSGVRRSSGHERRELRLEQIAGFVGEIAGQPFACSCAFCAAFERRKKSSAVSATMIFARLLEQHLAAGEVVAEEDEGA